MNDSDAKAAPAVIGLYDELAERYIADRPQVNWDENAWIDRFLSHVPSPCRVLDFGCGAGAPIGAYLLREGCTLTGMDSSPALIEHCRKCLPAGVWQVADMRQPFYGASSKT